MQAWNVSAGAVKGIVEAVSAEFYGGNLCFKREPEWVGKKKRSVRFTLTVKTAFNPGGRRSNEGRKVCAACWHCHRDVMKMLFSFKPNMRLKTAQADYRGVEDFEEKFESTGYTNIGSQFSPLYYNDACECDGEK